ncbi:hypothetical protein [Nitrosopumilus ureiphilus]|uniref:Uncharacterized protein n=1 Tax=Nitrosopumilus ureiphilus TaxID=1470067 RepID=A0A7D5M978_9ARCH|nr:hypothetical protein [Nitrosopumilus ureiphilus]QLH06349.1 hypothetical protein C5F50_04105 [Nitrosopumilus ureiphilus]
MSILHVWIGFSLGILFAGFLAGYVYSEQINSPGNLMAKDPDTTERWREIMLGTMMNDPELHDEIIEDITKHPQMMNSLRENQEFLNQLNNP